MSNVSPRSSRVREARRRRRRLIITIAVGGAVAVIVAATIGIVTFATRDDGTSAAGLASTPPSAANATQTPVPRATPTESPAPAALAAPPPAPEPSAEAFDKGWLSTSDPNSPWVVVNKLHAISNAEGFEPSLASIPGNIPNPNGHQLHPFAVEGLTAMAAAAREEVGATLVAQSGYRSYSSQVRAFDYYVNLLGVEAAEQTSARPGFSEHQTGFAVDILDTESGCTVDGPCFGETEAGQWLAANAWRFGFLLRYPADKTGVTGYEYEPWHFRYVGPELAEEMHNQGVTTLEEFFGIPSSPRYR